MKKLRLYALVAAMAILAVSVTGCGDSDKKVTLEQGTQPVDRGTSKNNTYENQVLGLRCELDDSWTVATDSELMGINGIDTTLTDEEVQQWLNNARAFCDFYALKEGTANSINMIVENLGMVNKLGYSEKAYAESTATDIDTLAAEAGMANFTWEQAEIPFAGGTHYCTTMEYDMEDVHYIQKQVYVGVNDVMVSITFTSEKEADLENMIESFSAF